MRQRERQSERQQAHQLTKHLEAEMGQRREELAKCVEQVKAQLQAEAGGQAIQKLVQLVEGLQASYEASQKELDEFKKASSPKMKMLRAAMPVKDASAAKDEM